MFNTLSKWIKMVRSEANLAKSAVRPILYQSQHSCVWHVAQDARGDDSVNSLIPPLWGGWEQELGTHKGSLEWSGEVPSSGEKTLLKQVFSHQDGILHRTVGRETEKALRLSCSCFGKQVFCRC